MVANELPSDPLQLFAERPWRQVSPEALAPARHVPTMLSTEESQFYCWLARDWARGTGHTVDLGAFIGGSTARFATGQQAAGRTTPIIAYDRFTADPQVKRSLLYPAGIPAFSGNDILLLAHRLLTPFKPMVELRPGEFLEQGWSGEPIEILCVDIAKTAETADHVAAEFFPHLIPGRSIVVQQDFLHEIQPWLPAQMTLLRRHFTPLARIAHHCVAFLCTSVPTSASLDRARVAPLSDAQLTRLVRRAALSYRGLAGRYRFASMVRRISENPETREAWRMRRHRDTP